MKTLLQTTIWIPEECKERRKTLQKHLDGLVRYEGEWDLYIVNNCTCVDDMVENMCSKLNRKFEIFQNGKNNGWPLARNKAITKMMNENYDLIILTDCDGWQDNNKWIIKAQELSKILPAFMIRYDDPPCVIGKKQIRKHKIWLYNEWWGNINVLTRKAIEKVGGYDNISLPEQWGFHDCEYGRRLYKSGLLNFTGPFPSLCGCGAHNEHDDEYLKFLDPIKFMVIAKYKNIFWNIHNQILNGQKPVFFDYRTKL